MSSDIIVWGVMEVQSSSSSFSSSSSSSSFSSSSYIGCTSLGGT
jgi:hypothetical protein